MKGYVCRVSCYTNVTVSALEEFGAILFHDST
jgi:hypothetical protein